jgi:hypothetical protein
MSRGGVSVFSALMLLFVGAFILMAFIRFPVNKITPQETLTHVRDQFWQVFLQMADSGAISKDTGGNILNKIAGIITIFTGLTFF